MLFGGITCTLRRCSPVWTARQRVPPADAADGGCRLLRRLVRPCSAEGPSSMRQQQQCGQHHREQTQHVGPAQRRAARLPPPIAAAPPARPAARKFADASGWLQEAANHALSPHPGSAALPVSARERCRTMLQPAVGRAGAPVSARAPLFQNARELCMGWRPMAIGPDEQRMYLANISHGLGMPDG